MPPGRSISRSNITTVYGKTSDSRIVESERVFTWLICESYDGTHFVPIRAGPT